MPTDEQGKKWAQLRETSEIAMQKARQARHAVTAAFVACHDRTGPQPTDAQLQECEALERDAEVKAIQEREYLKTVFG